VFAYGPTPLLSLGTLEEPVRGLLWLPFPRLFEQLLGCHSQSVLDDILNTECVSKTSNQNSAARQEQNKLATTSNTREEQQEANASSTGMERTIRAVGLAWRAAVVLTGNVCANTTCVMCVADIEHCSGYTGSSSNTSCHSHSNFHQIRVRHVVCKGGSDSRRSMDDGGADQRLAMGA
jgi:hypothetical protein